MAPTRPPGHSDPSQDLPEQAGRAGQWQGAEGVARLPWTDPGNACTEDEERRADGFQMNQRQKREKKKKKNGILG